MPFELKVNFTGLCLYVVDSANKQVGVLMPDCRLLEEADPREHLDGTFAEPHVGYIRMNLADFMPGIPAAGNVTSYRQGPEYEVVHRFDRQLLSFVGDFVPEPLTTPLFDVPDFSAFAPGKLHLIDKLFTDYPPEALLMRTVVDGGTLTATKTNEEWMIPRRFDRTIPPHLRHFASVVKWRRQVKGDHVKVRISDFKGNLQAEFPLKPPDGIAPVSLKIANLCATNPLEWSEMDPRKVRGPDLDFKWLYHLLDPDKSTKYPDPLRYRSVLTDEELPVPYPIGQLSSGSDDCMPGQIGGTFP